MSAEKVLRVLIACGVSFALSFVLTWLLPPLAAIVLSAAVGVALGYFAVSRFAPTVLPVYRVEVRPDDYEREKSLVEKYPNMFSAAYAAEARRDAPEIRHLHGIPWHEAELPPKRHECWAQTDGWIGFNQTQRCACGAIRGNGYGGGWFERNSRNAKVAS